ncbi:MAG TPA: hypothetical protein VJ461_01700 [Candidatus Nanoarchaeia archaeon]|nr:hypothetical protein [Candidatus Nanoarchaeia archaeon]
MIKLSPSKLVMLLSILIMALITGCSDRPPGCHSELLGPVFGGCNSNFMIRDIQIEPKIECLDIDLENCANPTMILKNQCKNDLYIDMEVSTNETVVANPQYGKNIMIIRLEQEELAQIAQSPKFETTRLLAESFVSAGEIFMVTYYRAHLQDTTYKLKCKLEKSFTITYTVTRALC